MVQKLISEFVGTFMLVFVGTGSIATGEFTGGFPGHEGISFVFAMVVIAVIYSFGEISGAHINPAVTLGFYFARRFPGGQVLPYITVQIFGATAGSHLVSWIYPGSDIFGMTIPVLDPFRAFVVEVVFTFILMSVIIHTATGSREQGIMAGLAIGFTVGLGALVAGPLTGASMNPARSIGPALVAGDLKDLWIYITAPIAGSTLAILLFRITGKS